MKTIKILVLVSILAVTQSFALSKTQKNVLLGLGAGAVILHTLKSHNHHRYVKPHPRFVYIDSRHSHRKHKKHHRRNHHRGHHNYYSHVNHHDRHNYRNEHRHNSSWEDKKHHRRGHNRY